MGVSHHVSLGGSPFGLFGKTSERDLATQEKLLQKNIAEFSQQLPSLEAKYMELLKKRVAIDKAKTELERKLMLQRAGNEAISPEDEKRLALFKKVLPELETQINQGAPGAKLKDMQHQLELLQAQAKLSVKDTLPTLPSMRSR